MVVVFCIYQFIHLTSCDRHGCCLLHVIQLFYHVICCLKAGNLQRLAKSSHCDYCINTFYAEFILFYSGYHCQVLCHHLCYEANCYFMLKDIFRKIRCPSVIVTINYIDVGHMSFHIKFSRRLTRLNNFQSWQVYLNLMCLCDESVRFRMFILSAKVLRI